jgi:hypothetical protein
MKRGLVVTMLLLMILTSLNAGTLAVYTSTVDLAVLAVTAKRFALGVNQGSQSEFDLQIAPGELVSYNFDVSNTNSEGQVSEVAMDLLVEADFSSVYAALPGIKAQLLMYNGGGYETVASCGSDGRLSFSRPSAFAAAQSEEKHFNLTFAWDDGEDARAVVMGSRIVLPLSLYVRGVQHVE